ncbi:uncharacterized protein EI97DRAFT_360424, partial [Westerdykella ornata]
LFKPLSSAYSAELANFMYKCQGISAVTKRDFFRFFWKAWNATFKDSAILKAFEVTGISPVNSEAVLKKFKTKETERPSSSESSTSHENKQLKEALLNEKKRRQRGKPLLLEASQEYHGGAVFWSPSKAERRKAAKQEKADMLEERHHMRLAAKKLRIQQQQKKTAERKEAQIARAAEKQLRQDIQLSK